MAERAWTGPQWDAITARGGSVLVSAAAGSGKTAVLVERAVRLICDPETPVDADRLLVVTFSRAAAAEMKQRMGERIGALLREDPANHHLQRQQALLAGAQISTVDSFCLDLVRQNFQNLNISPDFSVIDQNELAILMQDCAAACIDSFYEADQSGQVPELVELLSSGRDDGKLAETILKIYEFSRSHPFFEKWLDDSLALYATDQPVAETVWGRSILAYAAEGLRHCLALERAALDLIVEDEKMARAYEAAFRSDLYQLERCSTLAGAGDWDGAVEALRGFVFEKLGPLRGDDGRKQRAKAARDQTKDIVGDLAGKYMNATGDEFRADLMDLRPKMELLFAMVRDFHERLWAAKSEKKRLHFSDLEHLALQLLVDWEDGQTRPSRQALEIADRYDYVLVDEYQDTNEVQDLIFTSVSRQQQNLFMVGDVKQSIYSFRQAQPEIFMQKKAVFFPYKDGVGQYPAKIVLDTNFRSRREVTGAVNYIFGAVMSGELGDVAYDEDERLQCGARYPAYDRVEPELLLIGAKGYNGRRDAAAIEAGEIAARIKAMIDSGYQVEDHGELRPATLRDFCILMRSPRSRSAVYVQELGRHGVLATAENAGGYLSAREVSAVVALLRALDNPLLDVELVAAMLSPLFDFDADDIARVRLVGRGKPFFTAIRDTAEEEPADAAAQATRARCGAFLAVFGRLRAAAALLPADRLLLRLYEETDALAVFSAMSMGESRRANLLLLVEYAADYHQMGYKQLGGFVGFLGRLAEREGDLAPAGTMGEGANAVRIMSIHKSKGLEFPVVFLADTAKSFNKVDLRQNTLLHSRFGFACVRRDRVNYKQYPTVPMQAIRLEAQRSILSEEMRILYVALTRAREKLIVTGVVKAELSRKLSGLAWDVADGRLPPYLLGKCGSYLDWMLAALLHHPSCDPLRETAGINDLELTDDGNPWRVNVVEYREDPQADEAACTHAAAAPAAADPALLERLRDWAAWTYPHLTETRVPTKLSVSVVAKGEQDMAYRFAARPKFLTAQRLTPTERGNALHKFMQFAGYEAARDDLEAEITRMGREEYLSRAECESLDTGKLRAFFSSALAGRIFRSPEVHRELKFMAECGQDILGEVLEDLGEGKVVLQGVADCVFIEDGGAVIVDYKTDRVPTAAALRARYEPQLRLYRRILADSLGVPVRECVLYSFHLSEEIPV